MGDYIRPQGFGAECEHGHLARSCERCDDAEEIASLRAERDSARAVAAVLADAYEHDRRPPAAMVEMALGWRRNG